MKRPLLALVLHASRSPIAGASGLEGSGRLGIDELAEGCRRVLSWHEELGVPLTLHLSGTLIEAAAWFRPDLLALVRRLARRGIVELAGGTYVGTVMPLFPAALNRRQCREHLWLLRRHLDAACPRTFWVPERAWDTATLAPVIADPSLANGGYRFVVLDDRHLGADPRMPAEPGEPAEPGGPGYWRTVGRPWRVEGGQGLKAFAVPEPLRGVLPPCDAAGERALEALLDEAADEAGLLVFADELERLAGVGPWSPDGAAAYRRLLEWLAAGGGARPIALPDALPHVPAGAERALVSTAPREPEAREELEESLHALAASEASCNGDRAAGDLGDLGWKRFLAAPRSRSIHDLLALRAALGARRAEAQSLPPGTAAEDGAWTLGDSRLQALVAPRQGGRVVLLAGRARDRSVLLLGGATRALADRGHEHDRWEARALRTDGGEPGLWLENVETGSALFGARKVLRLDRRAGTLEVDYHLPPGAGEVIVDCALGPDYYRLLREGRDALVPFALGNRRGARTGDVAAWVELPRSNEAAFAEPLEEAGHSLGVAIRPHAPRFRFRIGGGAA